MDYWFCVSVCLHVSVFSRERYNVQMLRASLSETPGTIICNHSESMKQFGTLSNKINKFVFPTLYSRYESYSSHGVFVPAHVSRCCACNLQHTSRILALINMSCCRFAVDLVVCVALGCDMFDCVYPTRTAVRLFP